MDRGSILHSKAIGDEYWILDTREQIIMEGERSIRGVATEGHSIQDTTEVEPCRIRRTSRVRDTRSRGECCVIIDAQRHG